MKKREDTRHGDQHQRSRPSKLTLHRETLHRLDTGVLADIAGGGRPAGVSGGYSRCQTNCDPTFY